MSVPEQVPYKEYRATGSNNSFEITFYLPDPKDLVVMVNKEIPLVGAYSIQGNTVVFSTPPNEGDLVELTRDTQMDRETNFKSYDNSFRPETINFDLDKIWLVLQEANLVDAKILARLKQEIEWRRTHDFNYDELAQVREKQLFDALKGYTDTLNAATNPGVFQGVIAGVVFAQDGKSIQTHLEEILDNLAVSREDIESKASQTYVDSQLSTKAPKATTYTKTEVDNALSTKASQSNTYTKAEVDTTFAAYAGGRKGYTTLALAQADQGNLPANTTVEVTNDGANNGKYQWNGTTLTKSAYDPLAQAKNYADSNPLFKKVKLKSGDNLNLINTTGIYYNFDDIPQSELLNMPEYPNGLAITGTLVVYDPLDAGTLALHQIFYPQNSVNEWHRKKIGVGLFSDWVQSVTTDTVSQIKNLTLAEAQTLDVHTMPVGNYSWSDFPEGAAIDNMPPITYKFGRLEIKTTASDTTGAYRMAIFYPYGRNKEFWINKNYESGWTGWMRYADADTLKAEITGAPQSFKPSLITPPRFYAMEGIETHIYPEHLLIDDYTLYNHKVFSYRGKHVNRGFVWNPVQAADPVGQYGVSWALHDKQTASELDSTSLLITLIDKAAKSGQTPRVMVIGDSYIDSGVITQQILDNAATDVMNVELIGTRGTAPNRHEGRSGWKISDYATNDRGTNPFWIGGKVDFQAYLTSNTLSTPDIILIELGVNDCFAMTTDADVVTLTQTAFAQLDTLIASFKAANPNIKVGLCLPPRYADQDAFGHDYGATYDAWRCSRNISVWNRELIARYKDSEANNIHVVASGFNVDTVNNYPTEQQPINSHNATLIDVQNNSVHPYPRGYGQIGDVMFMFIKAT